MDWQPRAGAAFGLAIAAWAGLAFAVAPAFAQEVQIEPKANDPGAPLVETPRETRLPWRLQPAAEQGSRRGLQLRAELSDTSSLALRLRGRKLALVLRVEF